MTESYGITKGSADDFVLSSPQNELSMGNTHDAASIDDPLPLDYPLGSDEPRAPVFNENYFYSSDEEDEKKDYEPSHDLEIICGENFDGLYLIEYPEDIDLLVELNTTPTDILMSPEARRSLFYGAAFCVCTKPFDECSMECVVESVIRTRIEQVAYILRMHQAVALEKKRVNSIEFEEMKDSEDESFSGIERLITQVFPTFPVKLISKLREAVEPILKMSKTISYGITRDSVLYAVSTLSLIRQLWIAPSYEHICHAVFNYGVITKLYFNLKVHAKTIRLLTDECVQQVMSWNSERTTEARNDQPSVMDEPEEWRLIYNRLLESDFVGTLRTMLVNMVAYRCFEKDVARKICSYIGAPKKKIPVIDVIPIFMQSIIKLVQFGEAVMRGEPLSEIFFAKDAVSEALEQSRKLLLFKDRLYTGLPTPRGMCQIRYRNEALSLVSLLEMFENELSPYDGRISYVVSMKEKLQDEVCRIEGRLNGDNRRAPIAICLFGDPGIGKSQLIQIAPRVYSAMRGWDYEDSLIYARSRNDDYWEGYNPFSNPFIHYSELGNESDTLAIKNGSKALQEINSLVDSCRFSCPMAFEDKGKIFANPEMVVVDTNNAGMHADLTMSNPAAIYRRFLFVKAVVREEFRLPHSKSLDVAESLRVGGCLLDRYHFFVHTRVPQGNNKFKRNVLLTGGSLNDLISLYADIFAKHLEQSESLDQFSMDNYIRSTLRNQMPDMFDNLSVPDRVERIVEVQEPFAVDLSQITVESDDFVEDDLQYDEIRYNDNYSTFNKAKRYVSKLCMTTTLWLIYTVAFQFSGSKSRRIWKRAIWVLPSIATAILGIYGFAAVSTICWACKEYINIWNPFTKIDALTIARKKHVVKYLLGMANYDPKSVYYHVITWGAIAMALVGAMITSSLISKIFSKRKNGVSESSQFNHDDETNASLYAHEDRMDVQTSLNRYKHKMHASWGSAYLGNKSTCFNGNASELLKCVSRNVRKAIVCKSGSSLKAKTHVFGLCGSYAVINSHAFQEGDSLMFCPQGYDQHLRRPVEILKVSRISNDKTLIKVNDQFKDITKHLFDDHRLIRSYEGYINGKKHACSYINDKFHFKPDTNIEGVHLVMNMPHSVGMCGLPLVGQITSKGAVVLGIHAAGADNDDVGFATPLSKSEIMDAISDMRSHSMFLDVTSEAEFDIVREEHNSKSFFRYYELPYVDDYGKLPGPVLVKNKSKLERRKFSGLSEFMHDCFNFVRDEVYGIPLMMPRMVNGKFLDAAAIAVNKMNKPLVSLNRPLLRRITTELVDRIVESQLSKDSFEPWAPIPMEEAINGASHDAYLRSMNMNTSSGFGFEGKKSVHFPVTSEDDEIEYREPSPDLKKRLNYILDCWARGIPVRFIFVGQYKDEARLMEKVMLGKTRIFYITPQDLLVLTRMLLGRFYTVMVEDCDVFCVALGFDMHVAGHGMVERLNQFCNGTDDILWDEFCILEGDYGGYDVSNPFPIAHAAVTVIYETCERLGYNDQALCLLRMLLSENLYPNVTIYNDLFCKPGMQPSGKYGTAEDNSLRGLLLLMYAWYSNEHVSDTCFFDGVMPYIYGDDVIAGVKPMYRDHFNNNFYQKFVEDNYGMTFTSASKDVNMSPFVTLRTMSFLRRTFTESPYEDNVHIAQLNLNSMFKTLEWRLSSSAISDMEQDEAALQSVLWEFFMHSTSCEHFLYISDGMSTMFFKKYGIYPSLPSFDEIYERIYGRDPCLNRPDLTRDWTQCSITVESKFINKLKNLKQQIQDEKEVEIKQDHEEDSYINELEKELEYLRYEVSQLEDRGYDFEYLIESDYLNHNPIERIQVSGHLLMYQRMLDLEATMRSLKRIRHKKWRATIESSFELEEDGSNPETKMENLNDMGGEENVISHLGDSQYLNIGQYEEMSLARFFERPIEISNFQVAAGADVLSTFSVWDLYTKNPTVRAKLRNYAYFKADLVVRVVISGSPFHYGKILLSYQALPAANDNLIYHSSNYILDNATKPLFLNYLSQARGAMVMDIKANRPVDMRCPYIFPKPMMNLHNESNTVVSAATSFYDALHAGDLYFASINTIRSASATPTPIGVQILCHAENVNLGCITATQIEITTESEYFEEKEDERKTGPVEKFSSKMAQYSQLLTVVPQIRPYALASGMVFQGIADISALMGFAKPTLYEDPIFIKNRPWSNSATTIGRSTTERLSLDPMQELTVDPRVCGHDSDDMSLKEVYSRKTYLTTFTWSTSNTPLMGSIFRCKVSPQMDTYYADVERRYFQPTALSYVQSVFKWWHGEIEYHIEVVCSAYHRGKIAVYYEPNSYQGALIDADISLNKNFIQIIDLQESQDIRFCVKWAQSEGMLVCERPGYGRYHHGPDFSFTAAPYTSNGYFGVVPYTTLQSPDGSDVEINVYVRGVNMVFGFMNADNLPTERHQVGYVESEFFDDDHDVGCKDLNPTSDNMKELGLFYFGEVPTSFRSLLKRFTRAGVYTHTSTIDGEAVDFHTRSYEIPFPEYDSKEQHEPSLFRYLLYAYCGYRGSRRHRIRILNATEGSVLDSGTMGATIVTLGDSNVTSSLGTSNIHGYTSMRGSVMFITDTNGGIEFETPFYSRNLFSVAFNSDLESPFYEDLSWIKSFDISADLNSKIGDKMVCIHETATGEDFSFMRFNGAPFYSTAL